MNKNKDFYAALALFQSLFKSHKGDIYTIIERFILAGVKIENLRSFSISDVEKILKRQFSIEIPKSVITRCVVNQDTFKYYDDAYHVIKENDAETDNLLKSLAEINDQNDDIVTELYSFIEKRHLVKLGESEKDAIRELFFDFVEDREAKSENNYFQDVARFIIIKEEDKTMQESLDAIKEGTIIYHGIKYTETSDAQTWKSDTIFFLDMEYLFAAFGLNGEYYKEFFYDFYNLVKEINDGSPRRNNVPRIQLMYFEKTKSEIDKFFKKAARLKDGHERKDPSTYAMNVIDSECTDSIAVMTYKNQFFKCLKDLGIIEYPHEINHQKNKDFLFETESLMKKIQESFLPEEEEDVKNLLHYADNINILREGRKSSRLDDCGYIFLSASRISTRFSKFLRENDNDAKTFVMCSMNLFTEEMWFRLRKGILDTKTVATFKVVSKAKCIISGLLNDSVSKIYQKLKDSNVSPEVHKGLYADLRSRDYAPENVNSKTIDEDLAFVNEEDYLHAYQEEQSLLRSKAQMADEIEKELKNSNVEKRQLREQNEDLKNRLRQHEFSNIVKARSKAKLKFCIEAFIYSNVKYFIWIVMFAVVLLFIFLEKKLGPFTIVSGLASIIALGVKFPSKVQKCANTFKYRRYRYYIENELSRA